MKNKMKQWVCMATFIAALPIMGQKYPYQDQTLTAEQRATDLVTRLTLEEKVALMQNASPAIPRLGIKAYDWWNEALHGVGRAGTATVFPQAIGMAGIAPKHPNYNSLGEPIPYNRERNNRLNIRIEM